MNTRIPLGLTWGALAIAVTLAGCAAPRMGSVIPREGGLYQVISIGESEKAALESALYSAESTCKGRAMRHVVIDHRTEYRGLGTETAAQTIEKVGRIIFGTTGQRAPQVAGEDDYRVTMQFRCEDGRR